jgi:hypothetical protein
METLPCAKAARNQRELDINELRLRELRQVVQEYIDDRGRCPTSSAGT